MTIQTNPAPVQELSPLTRADKRRDMKAAATQAQYIKSKFSAREVRVTFPLPASNKGRHIPMTAEQIMDRAQERAAIRRAMDKAASKQPASRRRNPLRAAKRDALHEAFALNIRMIEELGRNPVYSGAKRGSPEHKQWVAKSKAWKAKQTKLALAA